jgi:3-deoxy-7-phosphoheptulonate synthase
MITQTDDVRIGGLRPLLPPAILMEELPITDRASHTVATSRQQAEHILRGTDDRLLVILGPCSIHDVNAALEYADRVQSVADSLQNELFLIMRVYFEKPRTTVGWKGLINDPHLDGSFAINTGLRMARGLLLELANRGLAAGCEFLDTITPQFIADLVSWGAIGARTTESQIHRELASGLSMPVGFKNGTDGSIQIAIDAIGAASRPHHFLSVTKQGIAAIVETCGNDCCHVILRGSNKGPNHDVATVAMAADLLRQANLPAKLMVDCSHGNSNKDYRQQPAVVREVCNQLRSGADGIVGIMLESHLVEGKQTGKDQPLVYGQSITDGCMSWETTDALLQELAAAVAARRRFGSGSSPPAP